MTKPVIACLSDSSDNLNCLIYELHKYYGPVVIQTVFHNELFVHNSVMKLDFSDQDIQLLAIDINNSNILTNSIITNIIQLYPSSVKLIVGEKSHLTQIQRFFENNDSVLFLSRPWDSIEINVTLDMASQIYSKLQDSGKKAVIQLNSNENGEKKVTKRLQKLVDANMAKDSFLSIIAHDLKSPFVALQGISEILLNDWENLSDKTKLELIGDLHNTSSDTFKLLETLLEWSKLQKEKLEVTINEVKIYNLVNSTLKISENNASVKGIKINNEVDNHITVNTDENMIATVFRNLISNAIQYTQPGGKINITSKEEKDFCTFCVADNGSGIDKQHIIDVFSRGNRKKLNGNASAFKGLGLIICKDFVEKNGGQIWLETKKGLGSKFFFTIPC